MMGEQNPNQKLYYQITVEQFVSEEHPFRKIRPLIDTAHIRKICAPLYSQTGRPSIPPEQLILALVAGYLMGITSERKIVMHLQSDMAFRWFVGLDLDSPVWDASTFSQNRRRRFDGSHVMEKLFDRVIRKAKEHNLISSHVSGDCAAHRCERDWENAMAPDGAPEGETDWISMESAGPEED